ncbi:MAG: hypothetical protein H6706_12955 [Myxococcales bacterium]|nr:hypothetical protein [Myxococcales bacterium]
MSDPQDRSGALDALLDRALADGTPSAGFDARFAERLAALEAEEAARVDAWLDADQPTPGPGFDAALQARLAQEPGRVLPFRRRAVLGGLVALAAAAAVALFALRPAPAPAEPPAADLELLAHLDLLEAYDEVEALEALEDPETFELVAQLHLVAPEEVVP